MSLKEKVQKLFDRQHALTNESCRRYDKGLVVDDVKVEENEIQAKLQCILDEGLKGDYAIKDCRIEKDYALVTISNSVFEIPCQVSYRKIGLSEFARKPGSKQMIKRVEELKKCLTGQQLLVFNRYVVGTSNFEAQAGSKVFIICRGIGIVA